MSSKRVALLLAAAAIAWSDEPDPDASQSAVQRAGDTALPAVPIC